MRRSIKAFLFSLAALGICVGVVYATAGADFDWLSVSDGGILVGDEGAEGENVPTPDVIEFVNADSAVLFDDGGAVFAEGPMNMGSMDSSAPASMLMLWPDSSSEASMGAVLVSLVGDVGMGFAHLEGGDMVPEASVLCQQNGDVIVQLGAAAEGEGEGEEESLLGGGGRGASLSASAAESAEANPYRLPLPTMGWQQ